MQKEVSNTFIEQPLNIKEISTNFIKMCRNVMDLTQKIADCVPIIINNLNELATKAISTFQVLNEYSALTKQAGDITYEQEWFNCPLNFPESDFINNIISCYERNKASDNLSEQIDYLFFDYYDKQIDNIFESISRREINSDRANLIRQSFDAYKRCDYYLTIISLFPAFESLVYDRTTKPSWHNTNILEQHLNNLSEYTRTAMDFIGNSHYFEMLKKVYENRQIGKIYPISGLPNRNSVIHGFQFDFATHKVALNMVIMIYTLYCLPNIDDNKKKSKYMLT